MHERKHRMSVTDDGVEEIYMNGSKEYVTFLSLCHCREFVQFELCWHIFFKQLQCQLPLYDKSILPVSSISL